MNAGLNSPAVLSGVDCAICLQPSIALLKGIFICPGDYPFGGKGSAHRVARIIGVPPCGGTGPTRI